MKSDPEIEIKIGSTLDAAALDDARSKMDALGQSAEDAGQKGQQQAKSVITAAPRQVSALNAVTKAWGALRGAISRLFVVLGVINQVWDLCKKVYDWLNRAKVERQEKLAAAIQAQAEAAERLNKALEAITRRQMQEDLAAYNLRLEQAITAEYEKRQRIEEERASRKELLRAAAAQREGNTAEESRARLDLQLIRGTLTQAQYEEASRQLERAAAEWRRQREKQEKRQDIRDTRSQLEQKSQAGVDKRQEALDMRLALGNVDSLDKWKELNEAIDAATENLTKLWDVAHNKKVEFNVAWEDAEADRRRRDLPNYTFGLKGLYKAIGEDMQDMTEETLRKAHEYLDSKTDRQYADETGLNRQSAIKALKAYEDLWRDVAAPDWEKAVMAEAEKKTMLDIPKGQVLEALKAAGYATYDQNAATRSLGQYLGDIKAKEEEAKKFGDEVKQLRQSLAESIKAAETLQTTHNEERRHEDEMEAVNRDRSAAQQAQEAETQRAAESARQNEKYLQELERQAARLRAAADEAKEWAALQSDRKPLATDRKAARQEEAMESMYSKAAELPALLEKLIAGLQGQPMQLSKTDKAILGADMQAARGMPAAMKKQWAGILQAQLDALTAESRAAKAESRVQGYKQHQGQMQDAAKGADISKGRSGGTSDIPAAAQDIINGLQEANSSLQTALNSFDGAGDAAGNMAAAAADTAAAMGAAGETMRRAGDNVDALIAANSSLADLAAAQQARLTQQTARIGTLEARVRNLIRTA